jgi:cytochrome b pre-mRNA-processing protein 3
VGDLMVGKQMGKLMATLGGRLGGFRDARGAVDRGAASQQVVERNIAFVDDGGDPQFVARTLLELADRLDTIDNRQLMAGDLG